jgi:molybdate/tungstate transport system permease protein
MLQRGFKNQSNFRLTLAFFGGLVLLFIVAPLLGLLFGTSTESFVATINDKEVTNSIWLTLLTSMTATLLMGVGAIPLAYMLARKNFCCKRLILGIIDLPVVIPHSAAGIAILTIISRDGVVGKTAGFLDINLVGHPLGIMAAMAFVSVPFLINAARDGFAEVPVRLEKAAQNLGASHIKVFFLISLPLAKRSVISGLILMFARGMSEFGAVIIVAYHPMITPVLIYERFNSFGLNYARPVALLFIMVCLIFFIILRMILKEKKSHA